MLHLTVILYSVKKHNEKLYAKIIREYRDKENKKREKIDKNKGIIIGGNMHI